VKLAPEYPVATDRLRLRPLSLADMADLLAYRSISEVCRFVPFDPMDRELIAERLSGVWSRTTIEAEGDGLTLGVELAQTGRLIGDVVLFFRSAQDRGGELGWVFNPKYSGHGYATEAAHAMLHLAFDGLGLHRVTARMDSRNEASLRVAERLRMRREAHLIGNEWFKGEWTDEIDYGLLEDEWAVQHAAGPRSCRWPVAIGSPASPASG
jgi:RimJ/RimL family protein N-acetyltransferase